MILSKRLTIREMWQLHKLIKKEIKLSEGILIDEIQGMLERISPQEYVDALRLLYGNRLDIKTIAPADSVSLLIDGLTHNKFFDFSDVVTKFKP